jgi:hypothetical protein
VDALLCRMPACARGARPVLYLHAVRRSGFLYLEYWEYLPESRTAHTGIAELDGYHRDDWEGLMVKLRGDGTVVGARVRASGLERAVAVVGASSGGLGPLSGSRVPRVREPRRLVSTRRHRSGRRRLGRRHRAERRTAAAARGCAPRLGVTFDAGAVPPWQKQVWNDPEAVITGRPGDRARYARYTSLWARLCRVC